MSSLGVGMGAEPPLTLGRDTGHSPWAWPAVGGDRRWLSVPRACPGDRTCSRAGAGPSARGASALRVVPAALPASLDPALASAIVLSPVTGACGP